MVTRRQQFPLEDKLYTGDVKVGQTYTAHISAHPDEGVVKAWCTASNGTRARMVITESRAQFGEYGSPGAQFNVTRRVDGAWCQTLVWSLSNHPRYLIKE